MANYYRKVINLKKIIIFYITIFIIGIVVGSSITYVIMKERDNKNKDSIQETIAKEAKKLMLRNDMYNYVEVIEKRIQEELEEDKKIVLAHSSLVFDADTFKEIDKDNKIIKDGFKITDIPFKSETPLENSIITINEKGTIEEATVYIEGYKLTYDFIGVSVEETK